MNERKLATIEQITDIKLIEGADKICQYRIKGWGVVDGIGKYHIGDWVIFCSVDSWIPNSIAPFLSGKNEPKEYEGIKGEKLRSIRLRKTLSQGLILPLTTLQYDDYINITHVGEDVTEQLGIIKWEAPIPACLSGTMKGGFPSFIPKTSAERIQNLVAEFEEYKQQRLRIECSEKINGTSATYFVNNGEFGCCSRNMELCRDDANTYWRIAIRDNIEEKLRSLGKNVAISGEIVGSKINGNEYGLKDQEFYLFNAFDIDSGKYYTQKERFELTNSLKIKHVPIIEHDIVLDSSNTIESLLKYADGKSMLNPDTMREGLVFKCVDDSFINWKCISNQYLLSEK